MVITPISLCTSFRVCSLVIRSCFQHIFVDFSVRLYIISATTWVFLLCPVFLGVNQMFSVYCSLCVLESFIGSAAASCFMGPVDDGFDKERGWSLIHSE